MVAEAGPALRWEAYAVDGVTLGLDVAGDLEQPGVGHLLCRAAFAIAAAQGLTVYDPQLGRTVMEGDAEQIEAQVERGRAFAEGAPLGAPGAANAGAAPRLNPSTRIWVMVALLVLVSIVVVRGLSCLAR